MNTTTETMSTSNALWKNWEGRVVDQKFPLRQWLGGSDHTAVFLTERSGGGSQKAVIKLIPAARPDEDSQLSRWASAAKLSHPHLLRLFECGRCEIDGTRLLYVVMEYAEENLGEILPLRALSPEEVTEMLRPTAEALAYLHRSGFEHGRIRPSNIMAVDNQLKISADGVGKAGERRGERSPSAYDAPELDSSGLSPAADVWSLGATLFAVLTQNEPAVNNAGQGHIAVPETIPQPLREIALHCLQVDPQRRCTVADILSQLDSPHPLTNASAKVEIKLDAAKLDAVKTTAAHVPPAPPKRWILVPILVAALLLLAWVGSKFVTHQPAVPAAETRPVTAPPPADTPAAQSPAPFTAKEKPVQKGIARGRVLQQVLPDVSQGALNTIEGHVKVGIQVSVDASGDVSQAKIVSAGPSKYFADRALTAARRWKFTPPQVDGQAVPSEWTLRFQYGRTSTEVVPAEIKP